VDRSPTGTGVSGRLAIHYAGDIGIDERIVVESIIGSRFSGRVVETTAFGNYPAVIPEIEGTAHICGRQEFLVDPADPFRMASSCDRDGLTAMIVYPTRQYRNDIQGNLPQLGAHQIEVAAHLLSRLRPLTPLEACQQPACRFVGGCPHPGDEVALKCL